MNSEWYESFFTALALDFWKAAVPPAATSDEVAFLVRELGVSPPARLLDLPTGLGRHSVILASRGYQVTGIDLSSLAISSAQKEAAALGVKATFLVGDMRRAPPDVPFDAAFCFGNSFGYLSREDMTHFVRHMLFAVRPGGRWAIDTGAIAEALLPHLAAERTLEAGGVTYEVRSRYDADAKRLNQACTLVRGNERETRELSQAIYSVSELHELLKTVGWKVLHTYGSLDGRPFEAGARRLLVVAERPTEPAAGPE